MLDLLISVQTAHQGIDDLGIREEVDTFIFEVRKKAKWKSGAKKCLEFYNFFFRLYSWGVLTFIENRQGHDTTTMGMCFALLLLAEHKEIQVTDEPFRRK